MRHSFTAVQLTPTPNKVADYPEKEYRLYPWYPEIHCALVDSRAHGTERGGGKGRVRRCGVNGRFCAVHHAQRATRPDP